MFNNILKACRLELQQAQQHFKDTGVKTKTFIRYENIAKMHVNK